MLTRTYGAAALIFFSVLAIVHTWPVAAYAGSRAIDTNDGLINAWLLTTVARQVAAHPLNWFDINMYYPYRGALAALDHQFSSLPLVAPVTLLTSNPLLAMNVFVIASFALAGTFGALLVRDLTGSAVGGLVGGCIFAFSPLRLENLPQTHVLGGFWLPLALYTAHRFTRQPTWTHLIAAGLSYLLLALASWYYAVIGAIALLIVGLGELAVGSGPRAVVVRRACIGAIPILLVLVTVARPYATIAREFVASVPRAADVPPNDRSGDDPAPAIDRTMKASVMQALSAPVESYIAAPARSRPSWTRPLRGYGQTGARFFPGLIATVLAGIAAVILARAQISTSKLASIAVVLGIVTLLSVVSVLLQISGSPFLAMTRLPGFFILLFAAVALWLVLPSASANINARTYFVLGTIAALLSFGEQISAFKVTIGSGVYPAAWPPFNLLRAPARIGVLCTLATAVIAGFGYRMIADRTRQNAARLTLALAVLTLVNVELMVATDEMPRISRAPEPYRSLKTAPDGPVLEFPLHRNGWSLYWSLFHEHPMTNGYGLVEPAAYQRLKAADDLSPDMLEHARAYFHPRYVVVNRALYDPAGLRVLDKNLLQLEGALTTIGTFGSRSLYEVTGPSRGTTILRSYPAWMVADKNRVGVRARIEAPVTGRTPVLQVWGNGQLLAMSDPRQAEESELIATLPPHGSQQLDVEVMADYTLPRGTGAPIGGTGRLAPADIAVTVTPERTRIQINGHVWIGRKGYTLVALHPDGRVEHVRGFNTSWSESDSHALADFVRSLGRDRVVVVASAFDVSRALTADAVEALASAGFKGDLRGKLQWAHAGIGVAGAAAGTAVESIGEFSADCALGRPETIPLVVDQVRIY